MFSSASTVVAVATPPGRGGIGVIRLSGAEALVVARRILVSPDVLDPGLQRDARGVTVVGPGLQPRASAPQRDSGTEPAPGPRSEAPGVGVEAGASAPAGEIQRDSATGRIPNPESRIPRFAPSYATHCYVTGPSGHPIDEVVATFFEGPHSYTGEDVVEISAHGSPELLREILQRAIAAGARLAEPGEFTLRAFLNGRLDLAQAEAVNDLVEAVTPLQARVAFDQLQGTLTEAIGALDRELFDLVVRLEASLDFPDEGYHFADRADIQATLAHVRDGVAALLATARRGRVVREGRQIAILGKPNVGKSTLFNRLVGADRAIVTDIPGTTRDLLTETIDFEGIRLGVVDTAGIRAGADVIEAEGVARARRAAAVADVVVLVFDRSRPLERWDHELLDETRSASRVLVANKTDLAAAWGENDTRSDFAGRSDEITPGVIFSPSEITPGVICLRTSPSLDVPPPASGAEDLRDRVPNPESRVPAWDAPVELSLKSGAGWQAFRSALLEALEAGEPLRDTPMVTNVRHQALLEQALATLEKASSSVSEEFLLADLADARRAFEEITGKRTTEDVLRAIFSRFCIGK